MAKSDYQTSHMLLNITGIILDNNSENEKQDNAIRKSCYYKIRCIANIRPYITTEARTFLVLALLISSLDFGKALLDGISLDGISQPHFVRFLKATYLN